MQVNPDLHLAEYSSMLEVAAFKGAEVIIQTLMYFVPFVSRMAVEYLSIKHTFQDILKNKMVIHV